MPKKRSKKRKGKNKSLYFIIPLLILIAVGVIYYLGVREAAFDNSCGSSHWNIIAGANADEIKIPVSTQINTVSCMSGYNMLIHGTAILTTQEDCEKWGLTWREVIPDIDGTSYNCHATDENWINDKTLDKEVSCEFTCVHPQGCTLDFPTGAYTQDRTLGFNGEKVTLPNPSLAGTDNDWNSQCTGAITISLDAPPITITVFRFADNACTSMEILESARTSNDYDTLALCEANIVTTECTQDSDCDTGEECVSEECVEIEVNDTNGDNNDTDANDTDVDTVTPKITCYKDVNFVEQSIFSKQECSQALIDATACSQISGYYDTNEECLENADVGINYLTVGLLGGGIIIVVVVLLFFVLGKMKGKKRK